MRFCGFQRRKRGRKDERKKKQGRGEKERDNELKKQLILCKRSDDQR
jgi:hypothetical protein